MPTASFDRGKALARSLAVLAKLGVVPRIASPRRLTRASPMSRNDCRSRSLPRSPPSPLRAIPTCCRNLRGMQANISPNCEDSWGRSGSRFRVRPGPCASPC